VKILAAALFVLTGLVGYFCSAAIRNGDLASLPWAWQSKPFLQLMLFASVGLLAAGLVTAFVPRAGRALAFSAAGALGFLMAVSLLGCLRLAIVPRSSVELAWGPVLESSYCRWFLRFSHLPWLASSDKGLLATSQNS